MDVADAAVGAAPSRTVSRGRCPSARRTPCRTPGPGAGTSAARAASGGDACISSASWVYSSSTALRANRKFARDARSFAWAVASAVSRCLRAASF